MIHPLSGLAHRSVSGVWTEHHGLAIDRELWLLVLSHHAEAGLVDEDTFSAFYRTRAAIPGEAIRDREHITRHDIKAHIDIWCEQAGTQGIHLGMTSADIVENRWAIQVKEASRALWFQAGNPDGMWRAIERYPMRGIWGATGTGQDMVDLVGADGLAALNHHLEDRYAMRVLDAPSQVGYRSDEIILASSLMGEVARLRGAVGQWSAVASGYLSMLAELSGRTWNEGDVSSSVVRRVAIPGLFLALSAWMCADRTSDSMPT